VADKLSELFKQNRTDFESKWSNIDLFVKYGMLSDEKFAEKGKEFCLLTDAQDKSYTIDDYKQNIASLQTDKSGQLVVLYTNHLEEQYAYVKAAESRGYSVLKLEGPLDNHFTAYLEQHNDKLQCKRVDADALDKLIPHDKIETALLSDDQVKQLSELFEKGKQRADLTIVAEALSVSEPLITVTESEYDRRMREMSKMNGFNMFGDMPIKYQGVVNTNHAKAKAILDMNESDAQALIKKAISLALLSKGLLKGADLNQFVQAEFEKL
jgi:molecular chaperone HtpG